MDVADTNTPGLNLRDFASAKRRRFGARSSYILDGPAGLDPWLHQWFNNIRSGLKPGDSDHESHEGASG